MRFSKTLTVAAAGLSFAMIPHVALGQRGGGKHGQKSRVGCMHVASFDVNSRSVNFAPVSTKVRIIDSEAPASVT